MLDVNGWEDILCGVDIGTEWNLKFIDQAKHLKEIKLI